MVQFGYYSWPFGQMKIGAEDGKIVFLKLCDAVDDAPSPTALTDLAAGQLTEYFEGRRVTFTLPLAPRGTTFQQAVWNALLEIPYGETRSYQDIAISIGRPNAARAVGMACNKNPIWIVIPCHRVVGASRNLTGYAGGLHMKQALLELENT